MPVAFVAAAAKRECARASFFGVRWSGRRRTACAPRRTARFEVPWARRCEKNTSHSLVLDAAALFGCVCRNTVKATWSFLQYIKLSTKTKKCQETQCGASRASPPLGTRCCAADALGGHGGGGGISPDDVYFSCSKRRREPTSIERFQN